VVEDAGPFLGAAAFREGIEDERFVGAAGHAFGHAAQDAVGETAEEKEHAAVERGEDEQDHFRDHEGRGGDDEGFAADAVGEDAGGQIGEDDGDGPGEVEEGVLGGAEAEVEEEDGEDGVVEARVEEDAEEDEATPVAVGIVHVLGKVIHF
jgi:hypothetical protein